MKSTIKIFDNAEQLALAAAADLQQAVDRAGDLNRKFNIALSGGTTPKLLFQTLAHQPFQRGIPWQHVHFFWGDERCVPANHPESNFGMTKKYLIDHIDIPQKNIHPIRCENNPLKAASYYADEILNYVPKDENNFPRFDCILLGMGTDGHTASIFPSSDVQQENEKICAVATHPVSGQKRVTLTLPVIKHAKRVSFLVTGKSKSELVAKIVNRSDDVLSLPAAHVRPEKGTLEWLLDREAGSLLNLE